VLIVNSLIYHSSNITSIMYFVYRLYFGKHQFVYVRCYSLWNDMSIIIVFDCSWKSSNFRLV